MKLTLDFETRSAVNLKKCGVYVYAESKSTDIICLAVKVDDGPGKIWIAPKFLSQEAERTFDALIISDDGLQYLLDNATEFHAHNASFEQALWRIMVERYGFSPIPLEKWHCTAVRCALLSLPRSLEGAAKAVDAPVQKDKAGWRLMMKMCKPRKTTKHNKAKWHETPEAVIRLCQYCIQDVETEYAIDQKLPPVQKQERNIWLLDQKINNRGIYCDKSAVTGMINAVKDYEALLLGEMVDITDGAVRSPRQVGATICWLKERGVVLPDLTKQTVAEALSRRHRSQLATRVLEIRQELARASTAKYGAMQKYSCEDSRIRGTLLFAGASTGRWTGKGIQPQNLPRPTHKLEEIEMLVPELSTLKPEVFREMYGSPMDLAASAIRSMLRASPGNELICADFNAIEARVLAWGAGDAPTLQAFWEDKELYIYAASLIYNIPEDKVSDDQRFVGKIATLALGYGGGVRAFLGMAKDYGVELDADMAQPIVDNWRAAHPKITGFWKGLESAAKAAIEDPGTATRFGKVLFAVKDGVLYMRLPSGRRLSFWDPEIQERETPWGALKSTITFMGVHSKTRKWERLRTYGGMLAENWTQAVAREMLAEAMLRIDAAGFDIVMHVHDEIIAEGRFKDGDFQIFCDLMSTPPDWAKDCPIAVKGWQGIQYRK